MPRRAQGACAFARSSDQVHTTDSCRRHRYVAHARRCNVMPRERSEAAARTRGLGAACSPQRSAAAVPRSNTARRRNGGARGAHAFWGVLVRAALQQQPCALQLAVERSNEQRRHATLRATRQGALQCRASARAACFQPIRSGGGATAWARRATAQQKLAALLELTQMPRRRQLPRRHGAPGVRKRDRTEPGARATRGGARARTNTADNERHAQQCGTAAERRALAYAARRDGDCAHWFWNSCPRPAPAAAAPPPRGRKQWRTKAACSHPARARKRGYAREHSARAHSPQRRWEQVAAAQRRPEGWCSGWLNGT